MEWATYAGCMVVGRAVGRVAVSLSDRLLDYLEGVEKEKEVITTRYYHSDADINSGWEMITVDSKQERVLEKPEQKPVSK